MHLDTHGVIIVITTIIIVIVTIISIVIIIVIIIRCTVLGYRASRPTVSWTRETAAFPTPVALTFNEKAGFFIVSFC